MNNMTQIMGIILMKSILIFKMHKIFRKKVNSCKYSGEYKALIKPNLEKYEKWLNLFKNRQKIKFLFKLSLETIIAKF